MPLPVPPAAAGWRRWLRLLGPRQSRAEDAARLAELHRVGDRQRRFWSEVKAGRLLAERNRSATPTLRQ